MQGNFYTEVFPHAARKTRNAILNEDLTGRSPVSDCKLQIVK